MNLSESRRLLSVFTRYMWQRTGRGSLDTLEDGAARSLDVRPAESRAWYSRRRGLFLILVFASALFLYTIDFNDITPDWSPKWLIRYNTTNLWTSLTNYNKLHLNLTETQAAAAFRTQISATRTTARTHEKTDLPVVVPYVSPGPYLVEYPYEYHFIINEPHRCEQLNPFLVLMVPVAPNNRKHRDNIRKTWGGQSLVLDKVVTLFFILGRQTGEAADQLKEQLLQESQEHGDLIQSDFLDCYKNLTIKTMVMLEWLDSHCSGASYAMKIDSDIFLNIPKLVAMLTKAPRTTYLTGLVERAALVFRQPGSKWYIPMEVYPKPVYPPYALGLGYVFSLDLPKRLVDASAHVRALYLEDVYVGMCMQYLGIPYTDPPADGYFYVFPVKYNRCVYSRLIATTIPDPADLLSIWRDFKRPEPYC